jgi:hypothetical protein
MRPVFKRLLEETIKHTLQQTSTAIVETVRWRNNLVTRVDALEKKVKALEDGNVPGRRHQETDS